MNGKADWCPLFLKTPAMVTALHNTFKGSIVLSAVITKPYLFGSNNEGGVRLERVPN